MGILDAQHLTPEELMHYASIGAVRGFAPDQADLIEQYIDCKVEELTEDDESNNRRVDLQEALKALEQVFAYEPNRQWFAEAYATYLELKDE